MFDDPPHDYHCDPHLQILLLRKYSYRRHQLLVPGEFDLDTPFASDPALHMQNNVVHWAAMSAIILDLHHERRCVRLLLLHL